MVDWIGFHLFVIVLLTIDLNVSKHKQMRPLQALCWSVGWIGLALLFNGYVYFSAGPEQAVEFLTAYLVEKSLSVDNLFVFLLVFSSFKVPQSLQRKVLFWGVIGAIVFRLGLILTGLFLITLFHWVTYLLGLVVAITGIRLIGQKKMEFSLKENGLLRWTRRHFKVTDDYVEDRFVVWRRKVCYLTPLLLVLLFVESTDLIFALDSIPAVLAVTRDPLIAYTSNVFAVLGLRSLYFVIAPWFERLANLKIGLGTILVFIGTKMLIEPFVAISLEISLAVIATILLLSTLYSILKK